MNQPVPANQPVFRLTPEGVPPASNGRIYDCVLHLIHCTEHQQVALACHRKTPVGSEEVYSLPFTPLSAKQTWQISALNGSFRVLTGADMELFEKFSAFPPYREAYILQVMRVQMPDRENTFFTRLVFYVRLQRSILNKYSDTTKAGDGQSYAYQCCQNSDRIKWHSFAALAEGVSSPRACWGPEVFEFCRAVAKSKLGRVPQKIRSYSPALARALVSGNTGGGANELLSSAKATVTQVDLLFVHFLEHCFPSLTMQVESFKTYMRKCNFEAKTQTDNRLVRLFCAFNHLKTGYLTFHELLIGLAALDAKSKHNKERLEFVFRFYDRNHDGQLSEDDLRKLMHDISPLDNEKAFEEKFKEVTSQMKVFANANSGISFADFQHAVDSKLLPNTTLLCRSPQDVFPNFEQAIVQQKIWQQVADLKLNCFDKVVKRKKYHANRCSGCTPTGRRFILNPNVLEYTDRAGFPNVVAIMANQKQPTLPLRNENAYELLRKIQLFAKEKGTIDCPNGVLMNDENRLCEIISLLLKDVLRLFNCKLGKCVEVTSPCYVIGDLHGNLEDLMSLEKTLWRCLPIGPNVLFLGDYVDRGSWSVECALYVLALKVLFPHKVTCLRGNHEVEAVQKKYSFERECIRKYPERGLEIFDMLNLAFSRMPVCAIIDDVIYCAHGGIPRLNTSLQAIREMPEEIRSEADSELFWEIVWSDPIDEMQYQYTCALFQQDPNVQNGYVRNTKRGAAWFFAQKAAENFFRTNNLTHIIRAHEVPANGFTFHFGELCATVFSCSHYNESNMCAIIFVSQEFIRVLQIDTTNNLPPFDPKGQH